MYYIDETRQQRLTDRNRRHCLGRFFVFYTISLMSPKIAFTCQLATAMAERDNYQVHRLTTLFKLYRINERIKNRPQACGAWQNVQCAYL